MGVAGALSPRVVCIFNETFEKQQFEHSEYSLSVTSPTRPLPCAERGSTPQSSRSRSASQRERLLENRRLFSGTGREEKQPGVCSTQDPSAIASQTSTNLVQ